MASNQKLQVLNQFLGKADAKDKICATIQYACMFISAGEVGQAKSIQASVASARKVFRVCKPWESVAPMVMHYDKQPTIAKLKAILMAVYFGGDHVVWASQAKLIENKELAEKAQKISLYSWFGGSVCGIVENVLAIKVLLEKRAHATLQLEKQPSEEEVGAAKKERRAAAEAINTKSLALVHGALQARRACQAPRGVSTARAPQEPGLRQGLPITPPTPQAALAVGLLQLMPLKPRTVGAIGAVTSAMNCYMMLPAPLAPAKKTS